jgi:hypothetical protein
MARQSKLGPYDEETIGQSGLNEGGSEPVSHGPHRPAKAEAVLPPEDHIPLFLCGPDEEKAPQRWVNRRRILKAGMAVTVGVAIVFAILSKENPQALFSNAKASFSNTRASLPDAPVSQPSPAPSPPAVRLAGEVAAAPAKAIGLPSRDEMAAALRAAHDSLAPRPSQAEIRQPPAAAAPARRMDADELAALLTRAKGLMAIGDIAPARLLLERAADAQEASAALLLAQTYDPAVLGTQDLRSITPDPAMARAWYQKAARFGSLDAQQRLADMQK